MQRDRVGMLNINELDITTTDDIEAIVLPLLIRNTKFVISSGLLQMQQHRGLFSNLPSKDPYNHLQNVFIYRNMRVNKNFPVNVVRISVFPLSLTGEAIGWLSKLPYNSISTCGRYAEQFFGKGTSLCQWSWSSKTTSTTSKKIVGESISAARKQFIKYLRSVPNDIIIYDSLVEIFYWVLYDNSKAVVDTITGGSFLDCTFDEVV